jgi:C4-type Zn-finger protein
MPFRAMEFFWVFNPVLANEYVCQNCHAHARDFKTATVREDLRTVFDLSQLEPNSASIKHISKRLTRNLII